MSYVYTRNKRRVFSFGGLFDPTVDQTQMQNNWVLCTNASYWTVVAAPGGGGGYAHKFDAVINSQTGSTAFGDISPFLGDTQNKQGTYANYNPYKWKYKAEFRMYITEDLDQNQAGKRLINCAGFCLDGAQPFQTVFTNSRRIWVRFNVDAGLCGIATMTKAVPDWYDIYTTAWSGSYSTYYDIRVYWEYDFFTDPDGIKITVFQGQTQLFQQTVPRREWRFRADPAGTYGDLLYMNQNLGRAGLGILAFDEAGTATTERVTAYFKDILITMDEPRLISYKYSNSIIRKNAPINLQAGVITSNERALGKGVDIQIFLRNSTSDNFTGQWRGIIRSSELVRRKVVNIQAEGVATDLFTEKVENISLTTKTTGDIVKEAIANPDKTYINTSAYFDTTTTTYNRDYMQRSKVDLILEAGFLEGYFSFLDGGNNWHFQSPRSNYTTKHLIYGSSRIISYETKEVFIRKPNLIRIIGTGVYAERYIVEEMSSTTNILVRNILRLDLETQAECEDEADYYSSLFRRAIQILELTLYADFSITPNQVITVTVPKARINNKKYLVAGVKCDNLKIMTLSLLELSPGVPLLLSDIGQRTDTEETERYGSDTIAATPQFNVEGLAKLNVNARFEIEFSSTIVRSGDMTITDDFIDNLLKVWDGQSIDDPTHIGWGTGTTTPRYDNTALASQSGRSAATATKQGILADYTPINAGYQKYYSEIKFEFNSTAPGGITEVGLFNAASGGEMTARATFANYVQASTFTIRIILNFYPEPHSSFVTWYGVDRLIEWLNTGTFISFTRVIQAWAAVNIKPTPWASSSHYEVLTLKKTRAPKQTGPTYTFTKSINFYQDEIIFNMDYPDHDIATDFEGGSSTVTACIFLALSTSSAADDQEYALIMVMNSTEFKGDNIDGSDCLWRAVLQIERGEIVEP